jgi:hypothetical protein
MNLDTMILVAYNFLLSFVEFGIELKPVTGVKVDGLTFRVTNQESKVKVKCRYPSSILISTKEYLIKPGHAKAAMSNVGDLSSGFKISLYDDPTFSKLSTGNVIIGGLMYVDIAWTVDTAASNLVNFYLSECDIVSGRGWQIIKYIF